MRAVNCKVFPDDTVTSGQGQNGPWHRQKVYVEVEAGKPMQQISLYVNNPAGYPPGNYILAEESLVVRQGKLSISPVLTPAK
jgi:hypothetical protein